MEQVTRPFLKDFTPVPGEAGWIWAKLHVLWGANLAPVVPKKHVVEFRRAGHVLRN